MPEFENPEIFRVVLESLQTGVYFVDREQKILFWNEGAEKITGYLRQEVVGAFCRENLVAAENGGRNVLSDAAESVSVALRDGKPTISEFLFGTRRVTGFLSGFALCRFETATEPSSAPRKASRRACLRPIGTAASRSSPTTAAWTTPPACSARASLAHLREKLATFAEHRVPFSILLCRSRPDGSYSSNLWLAGCCSGAARGGANNRK